MATATFGAGCFWGVEATFRQIQGVTDAAVGYMGGSVDNPSYQEVCTDTTGHAEVLSVDFDPDRVTFDHLLDVFFQMHDPTTLNRQGPDYGSQYRSAVFYHSPEQKDLAEAAKKRWDTSGRFERSVVTDIAEASTFWPAEDYHQRYLEKRGMANCHVPEPR